MENRNNIVRMLAFVLLLTMLVSIFASCEGLIITPGTTATTTTTKIEDPEQPHICEFGSWELVQEATATKDGLSERKCEECGAVEQRVIPASVKEYTITYIDAPQHNNPTRYTVNDYIDLQKAVWNGLSFAYWTDKDGNILEEIPYGTEGNITLYANWRLTENITISNNSREVLSSIYNKELNVYQFTYKLGTIQNVVLDELSSYKYSGATNHTWSISETISFTESKAQNVSNTISKSVTTSTSWSEVESTVEHKSDTDSSNGNKSLSFTVGPEWLRATYAGTHTDSNDEIDNGEGGVHEEGKSTTTTENKGGSSGSSSAESNTVASTISFATDTTTEIIRSETLDPLVTPAGLYRYVQAGDIEVYLIVTYDIATKDYFINIFSNIYRVFDMMIYEPAREYNGDLRIVDSESFEFDIDIDALAEKVNNAYYIEFDANGGTGSMPTQMMIPGTSTELFENQFTKAGNAFVGWRVKGGDTTKIYLDGQSVKDLGSPKETVTLEAIWTSTEPVWVQTGSGSFLYASFPSGFDQSHSIYTSMQKSAYEEYETETTKRVVTIEKIGYVYWHWMYSTVADAGDRVIYYQKGTYSLNGYGYKNFGAFLSSEDYRRTTSNRGQPTPEYYWYTDTGRTSNADSQGSKYWYRFEYYRCTYTDYELAQ